MRVAYDTLGLQSYLTAGDKECRAWTIPQGATAPQAAGVIHTDFERGFIAANICKYDDLVRLGSEKAVKEAGLMRQRLHNARWRCSRVSLQRFEITLLNNRITHDGVIF